MNNRKAIQEIQDWADTVEQAHPVQRDIVEFNLKDMLIDGNTFKVEDMTLTEEAMKKILGLMNCKPEFIDYAVTMEKGDFAETMENIKKATGDCNLYGAIITNPDFTYSISDIYNKNNFKKKLDDMTSPIHVIKNLCDNLAVSDFEWKVKEKHYEPKTNIYEIRLENVSNPIEALPNDFWTQGHVFRFNSTEFKQAPYFERQVCTNGMTKPTMGFGTNISKSSFNNDKLNNVIKYCLTEINHDVEDMICKMAQKAKETNVSLNEFYDFRNFYEKNECKEIVEKYFNDAPFYKAWGQAIEEKSKKWQKTADTKISAYDFINLQTYLCSHLDQSKLTEELAQAMKIKVANFFCKGDYDLNDFAENVQVDFPHFKEME